MRRRPQKSAPRFRYVRQLAAVIALILILAIFLTIPHPVRLLLNT